ncbi:MAG: tyrosine--tRNA ligase [Thermoplasmata archaeon]|jgi:tyrosyl-tRNA synthetase
MIDKIKKNVVEIVKEEELNQIIGKENLKGYIGFEPSGLVHLGTGLICGNKVKDLQESGIKMTILLADWHAMINDKFNGDMEKIRRSAELMKESFYSLGIPKDVNFIYADELVGRKEYWEKVIKVAKNTTLNRLRRAMDIMGRKESDLDIDTSKMIYPFMQVADIFELEVDIALGGMDQRHAHMLARDVAAKLGHRPPIAIHTPLLTGLKGGNRMDISSKMSKSVAGSAIFITDSEDEIRNKIRSAYCPPNDVENNPIIDIYRFIIFPYYKNKIIIKRKGQEDLEIFSLNDLLDNYKNGNIHPMDLKENISEILIEILKPIREYFERHGLMEIVQELRK